MDTHQLLQKLKMQVNELKAKTIELQQQSNETLEWRPDATSWNMLECIEHLNLYGDFYLPEIKKAISRSNSLPQKNFSSGWLGGYFAKSMLPKEKLNKMKTFKDKNPLHNQLDRKTIDRFLEQLQTLQLLLQQAENVSLNKVRVSTSIARAIRLKLGDTFQFLINHMLRHFAQIERLQHRAVWVKASPLTAVE